MLVHIVMWILATLVVYIAFRLINRKVTKAFELRDVEIDTSLNEFKESSGVTSTVQKSLIALSENISEAYEQMCVLEPLKYRNNPRIKRVVDNYKKLLRGEILDPHGNHTPSENLLGKHNPDYDKYMAVQRTALKSAGLKDTAKVLQKEVNRVRKERNEEILRQDFIIKLIDMGLPISVLNGSLTDEKLNTFTAKDWKTFEKVVKGYIESSSEGDVAEFLETFDQKEIIFDSKKFESFVIYRNHEVPLLVVSEIIKGNITMEQATQILKLVDECNYPWKEAVDEVLSESIQKTEEDMLRKSYGWKG